MVLQPFLTRSTFISIPLGAGPQTCTESDVPTWRMHNAGEIVFCADLQKRAIS